MYGISGSVSCPCKIFWSGGIIQKMENTRFVNKAIVKKDAQALLSGRPVYTDDIAPADCLVVKLLRSPHAHAWIEDISVDAALKVSGIEAVFTYKDVPEKRYTQAGQTFPEPSPDDRLILDQHIRYNGDPVAIIAGKDENCVSQAMKRIKVKYKVLEPILDFTKAIDNPIIIHPEDNYVVKSNIGNDVKRNICASQCRGNGDIDKVLSECEYIIDRTYHTKAVSQAMMEVFCAFTSIDIYGRIKVISSTQIPFHARRIVASVIIEEERYRSRIRTAVQQLEVQIERGKLTREIIDTMIDTVYVYDKKRIEVILRFDDVLQKVISEYMEGAKGA